MKRFRIMTSGMFAGQVAGKFNTTQQCYEALLLLPEDQYTVEDLQDDIFVESNEFMEAFQSGECPDDLTFF